MIRLIDCLCVEHRNFTAEHCWPAAGDLNYLLDCCDGCLRAAQRHVIWDDDEVTLLAGLNAADISQLAAVHETGHAVVGALAGHHVIRLALGLDGDLRQQHGRVSGEVVYDNTVVTAEQRLATLWAGQEAELRWLDQHGLNVPINRVDVRFFGWHDTVAAVDLLDKYDLPDDSGRALCLDLLERNWPTVLDVARRLVDVGQLTGDDLIALAPELALAA